jgi:hypothetical protein
MLLSEQNALVAKIAELSDQSVGTALAYIPDRYVVLCGSNKGTIGKRPISFIVLNDS